jgi:hypothetical protein
MKNLFILLVIIGASVFFYKKNHQVASEGKNLSLSQKIEKFGSVPASEVFATGKEMVNFICKDEKVLSAWGSSSTICLGSVEKNEVPCASRIFPQQEKLVASQEESKSLISQYRKCVLPY